MKKTMRLLGFLFLGVVIVLISGCCSKFPNLPWCPDDLEDFYVTPSSITRLCPTHIGGDREFSGNGPEVNASATLYVKNDKEIWVKLYLHAKETKSNWTEAEDTWERLLWTVDPGKRIVRIDSDMTSVTDYVDTNHSLDRPPVRGGNLVSRFEIMGDTGGNDVGNCTSDDVYMNVYFNEIRGKMQAE